jgi:hypothetical protein
MKMNPQLSRDDKTAIRLNLKPRYADPGVQDFLHKSPALNLRFKSLLHLDAAARLRVYIELTAEIVNNIQQVFYNVTFFI